MKNPTLIRYEELWEPWMVGEPPPYEGAWMGTWDIPADLVARFKLAKAEMEIVWDELRRFNPDRE